MSQKQFRNNPPLIWQFKPLPDPHNSLTRTGLQPSLFLVRLGQLLPKRFLPRSCLKTFHSKKQPKVRQLWEVNEVWTITVSRRFKAFKFTDRRVEFSIGSAPGIWSGSPEILGLFEPEKWKDWRRGARISNLGGIGKVAQPRRRPLTIGRGLSKLIGKGEEDPVRRESSGRTPGALWRDKRKWNSSPTWGCALVPYIVLHIVLRPAPLSETPSMAFLDQKPPALRDYYVFLANSRSSTIKRAVHSFLFPQGDRLSFITRSDSRSPI